MALPQNPDGLTAGDRALLEASNAQTKTLKEQTRVLHKLSDSILEDKKDYRQLRKDIQENQRKFFEGNDKGFSSIKEFFKKQKSPSSPGFSSRSKMGDKDKEDKGFFKNALSKLFGPSKYQLQMAEEFAAIRDISELTRQDINFIRKQYEEPARARERELLAQAIADKINTNGGGEGFFSSLLGTLKDAFSIGWRLLVPVLGTFLLQTLPKLLAEAAIAIGAALSSLWSKLSTLLSETFEKIKSSFKSPATEPAKPSTPAVEGEPGKPGSKPGIPNTTMRELPAGDAPKQLPGPASVSDIEERMAANRQAKLGGVTDIEPKVKFEGLGERIGEGFKNAIKGLFTVEGIMSMIRGGIPMSFALHHGSLNENEDAELEARRKMMPEHLKPQLGPFDKGSGTDWEETIAEKIEKTFDNIMQMLEDDIGSKFMKANRNYFDQIGEISINGERVNLLPNLGTAAGKSLDDAMNVGKELATNVAEGGANYVASVTNNMIPNAPNGPLVAMPPAPAVNNSSSVQQMLNYGTMLGGRR